MYAYIDEAGNTGNNLFDPEQPTFMSAALITKTNFDIIHSRRFQKIAEYVGNNVVHANQLGMDKINIIAEDLLKVLKKVDARFYIAKVDKLTLAVTKLIDTIFDS
jgi:hypothetical protein